MDCLRDQQYYMFASQDDGKSNGFSLVELILGVAIIITVAAIAIPSYTEATNTAKIIHAIGDIKKIQTDILAYEICNSSLPDSLDDLSLDSRNDPWGNPYEYYNIQGGGSGNDGGGSGNDGCRKDMNLVPLNSDYDLYSKGRDGESILPLTAPVSRDDIVRASNGAFVGLATNY